ncbi:hypothetical protein KQI68_06440 [Peptoniphilus sp. MSJ-1]|uniref:Uncharacterized protein n=1 Tax=Peptoniphilus ovalis TaxID=2841503 RepID=A0ABS6FH42_9FIRM|nr:hypothetical protein [Peptoniphilus ovalis]MBU5669475.1 hypothetical protein [Peptoniphilus ovalis]
MKELELVKEKINKFFGSALTDKEMAKLVKTSPDMITSLRNRDIEDINFGYIEDIYSAIANYDNTIKQQSQNYLEKLKNGEEKVFYIKDKYNIKTNKETQNKHSLYRYKSGDEYYYGVYSDDVSAKGQVDSRKNTDEEILKAIEKEIWGCTVEENVQR